MTKKRWVYCPNCRHKLFLVDLNNSFVRMEIKCHSCKAIDSVVVSNQKIRAIVKKEAENIETV